MVKNNAAAKAKPENLDRLLAEIRACRICAPYLPHGVRPIIRASATARLCICAQAPGLRVHETGLSFNDPSGDRLRAWLEIDRDTFYDESRVAIVGMGFCFPGYTRTGADKPPRKECAPTWHARLFDAMPRFPLMLLVGTYAIAWHLGERGKSNMTETVKAWREYGPRLLPLPHPSWRNNAWLKKNPWFEDELLPDLRKRVRRALSS
ncbi:MAG TPA: uracil-DNA glycosylase family protein [Rhizomicrobium sp.]|nr:uracil-DNA glycosylase family protein [Rhizomicrobium sp.]